MTTKTIGIREAVYERLRAHKREDESFSDLIDRLLDEAVGDWRPAFGSWEGDRGERLGAAVEEGRSALDGDMGAREDEIRR